MKSVYDPQSDGMWMYGGWDHTYSQQLWFLQWSQPTQVAPIVTTQAVGLPGQASIQWQLPTRARSGATIQRSVDGMHWSSIGTRLPGGLQLPFVDRAVTPGALLAYRAVVATPGNSMASAPVWVTIPASVATPPATAPAFALTATGDASLPGRIAVRCTLPARAIARVELVDVAGRLRDSRDLSSFGAGDHRVELGRALEAGVYFVRLASGDRRASLKSLVLR